MNRSLSFLYPVILVLLSYISISTSSTSLKCFKCTMVPPNPYSNETERLCTHFDYSSKYIVDCPYSTLCMKKTFVVQLSDASIQGTVRDCAPQKYLYQAYIEGKWQKQTSIEEPYEEGCNYIDDKGARSAKTEYCYCRGYLCNAATNLDDSSYHVDVICVIFVYNALKLFYSFR